MEAYCDPSSRVLLFFGAILYELTCFLFFSFFFCLLARDFVCFYW